MAMQNTSKIKCFTGDENRNDDNDNEDDDNNNNNEQESSSLSSGDRVLQYLETHPSEDIIGLQCINNCLLDVHVQSMDKILQNYHSSIHLQSLELKHNSKLTGIGSGPSLGRILDCQRETLLKLDISYNPLLGIDTIQYLVPILVDPPPGVSCLMPCCVLQILNLSGTQLVGVKGATPIASLLKHNRTLQELYLNHNELGKRGIKVLLPELITNSSLKVLSISHNGLGSAGISILAKAYQNSNNSNNNNGWALQSLDVTSNSIKKSGMKSICEWLVHDRQVKNLKVGYNDFGEDGAAHIAIVLRHNYTLQKLYLPGNNIGDHGALVIAKELQEEVHTIVEVIDFSWNSITNIGCNGIADALQVNSKLNYVNLSNNKISNDGCIDLANCLVYNLVLETLILDHNDIEDDGAFVLSMALGQLTPHKNSGSRTRVTWNDNLLLTKEGINYLQRVPKVQYNLMNWFGKILQAIVNGTIGSIDMMSSSFNVIGNEELVLLTKYLTEYRPIIRSIWIGENNNNNNNSPPLLSHRSLLPFAQLACTGPTNMIQRLYIKNVKLLGDEGATAFGEALIDNPTLTVLVLSDCSITSKGIQSIAIGLKQNKSLRRLNLDYNSINDEGFQHLITTVLPHHPTLMSLHVGYNQLTDKALSLPTVKTLTELYMNGNHGITDRGALQFCLLVDDETTTTQLKWFNICDTQITKKGGETLRIHLHPAIVDY